MKNIVAFLSDTMVMLALIFVMGAAFLATVALSPIDFNSSLIAKNTQQNVLGEADIAKLDYEDKFISHDYFKVYSLETDQSYKADIFVGPVSNGKIEKEVVEIKNESSKDKFVNVRLKVALDEASDMKYGFRINDKNTYINPSDIKPVSIALRSGDTTTVSLIVELEHKLNYPIELDLEITEAAK